MVSCWVQPGLRVDATTADVRVPVLSFSLFSFLRFSPDGTVPNTLVRANCVVVKSWVAVEHVVDVISFIHEVIKYYDNDLCTQLLFSLLLHSLFHFNEEARTSSMKQYKTIHPILARYDQCA